MRFKGSASWIGKAPRTGPGPVAGPPPGGWEVELAWI
jgi:hypothetical protein